MEGSTHSHVNNLSYKFNRSFFLDSPITICRYSFLASSDNGDPEGGTALLGCIERTLKTVFKTKGVYDVTMDAEKEMVKEMMGVKTLVGKLMERLKMKVEVVPPKKEKEKEKESEKEGAVATGKGDNGNKGEE